ncbi:twin-arginine translocase TatA/TatE family subunit [Fangia hongkongensis]|uniref:twin-arginine translocase TatA/TatE family subunit n=1 Tax=Fangia hongkongensis TaxID=270495 RepID=UPI00037EE3FD
MSGISIWQLVIVFLILLLLFGSKKIKSLGGDLGNSIKSFKDAMKETKETTQEKQTTEGSVTAISESTENRQARG